MSNFETLCENITAYERKQLADDWHVHFNKLWEGVTFTEIVSDIKKFGGLNKNSWTTKDEICSRVIDYFTFAFGEDRPDRERLRETSDAFKILDDSLHLDLHDLVFKGQTADEIVDEWEEQERWEREAQERQEVIDFCAHVAFNDGLCESLDEAYEVAEMVC